MSNLIYACWRGAGDAFSQQTLERIADRISPDGIKNYPHRLLEGENEILCLTGPTGASGSSGTSAHLGAFAGIWPEWHRPESPIPDGSFALIRSDGLVTELCSDFAGTRTIWYVFTKQYILASTSQRALICLLQNLSLNRTAFAWFLSSGTLGPTSSWDTRISRLPRGARLVFDHADWTIQLHTTPVIFQAEEMDEVSAQRGLHDVLWNAIQSYDFRTARWIFPISGGYDSRCLLAALHETGFRPRTVTWGLASSRLQQGNDAYIAPQLAKHYGLSHEYLLTETSGKPPAEVVDTFLSAHGGTTDALFPYLDGLRMWSGFAAEGVDGIVRGDEGFGTRPRPEVHHRFEQGLILLSDFLDEETAEKISGGRQTIPDELARHPGESLQTYGDRLVHAHFIPTALASLNDVKAPFVEIANPMLTRSVLEYVRIMPDRFRSRRRLYERLTESVSPSIPFAILAADDSRNRFLSSPLFIKWISEELQSGFVDRMLPLKFRELLFSSIRNGSPSLMTSHPMRVLFKRIIPSSWVNTIRSWKPPIYPELSLLALRCVLASRLATMLEEDATLLSKRTIAGG